MSSAEQRPVQIDMEFIEPVDANTRDVDELHRRNEELRARNNDLRRKNAELQSSEELLWERDFEIRRFKNLETTLNQEIERLRRLSDESDLKIRGANETIEDLRVKFTLQQSEFESAKEHSQRHQSELTALLQQKEQQLAADQAQRSVLQGEINELRAKIGQLAAIEQKYLYAIEAGQQRSIEISRLQENETALRQETLVLKDEIADLENVLADVESSFHSLQDKNQEQSDELEETREDLRSVRAELTEATYSLQASQIEIANLQREIEALKKVLAGTKVPDFEAERAKYQSRIEALTEKQMAAITEMESLRNEIRDQQQVIVEERRNFSAAHADRQKSESILIRSIDSLQSRIKEHEQTIAGFSKLEDERNQRVTALERLLDKTEADIGAALKLNAQLESQVAAMKVQREESARQLKIQEERAASAVNESAVLTRQLTELHSELKARETEIESLRKNNEVLKADYERVAFDVKTLHEEKRAAEQRFISQAENFENELATIHARFGAEKEALQARFEADKESLRNRIETEKETLIAGYESSAAGYAAEVRDLQSENAGLRRDIEAREKSIIEIEAALSSREAEISLLQEQARANDELRTENRALAETNARLKENSERLNSEITVRQASLADAHEALEQAETLIAELELKNRDQEAQLTAREADLSKYADSLAVEKAEIKRMTDQLNREIQVAHNMNPLKDYLALTEFELSKIEIQLKTTPTLSSERGKLESMLTKMIEQRDFLKAVLAQSQRQLAQQAASLNAISQTSAAVAVPPPLPKKRFPL